MMDKIRVAFVDDEPHVLRGISRSMAAMEDEWEMVFCASGEEALTLVKERPFDVVVSDMRMPGMDGAQLLDIIRRGYPSTVRVILSGYADADSVLRTVGPAHIYLAKPCDAGALRAAIRRQISLRSLLESPQMRSTLAGLANLPSLPKLYVQLQSELLSPNCSAKTVAEIISHDVAMTAEILKLTNSAYFSAAGGGSSPLHAVRLMGIETVQALMLKVGVFRQFSGNTLIAPMLEALTLYSLGIASVAERIAGAEGGDSVIAKGAHIAAMLSDIGSVVLLDAHPEKYRRLLADIGPEQPLHRAEEAVFGASHALIGAYLLGLWGFSDTIVEAVAYCYEPALCPSRDNLALLAAHAARGLAPPCPLLPKDSRAKNCIDIKYLIEIGRDGHIPRWRELAAEYYEGLS